MAQSSRNLEKTEVEVCYSMVLFCPWLETETLKSKSIAITLHLCLVNYKVFVIPAALKVLGRTVIKAQILFLRLVQGEEGGGETTVAFNPSQSSQRKLLHIHIHIPLIILEDLPLT